MQTAAQLAQLRRDYSLRTFSIDDAAADPLQQFDLWMQEALQAEVPEPNAMTLSTVRPNGTPSARVVLLKGIEAHQFVFYTNTQSDKGVQLSHNPAVALTFLWLELERQVRIEGTATLLDEATATAYFQSRPRESQLGAWASPQSRHIPGRKFLEQNFAEMQAQFAAEDLIPKPDFWGGYQVKPTRIEFWQGRSSRLHDRVLYTIDAQGQWQKQLLAP
ncbi:pyridoxamine 5'-phosphate oxidase [Eisenibacter elegans]|uniref:pyridoxamine 5'-phosphate oxidase n=1 Tax=Eisenibacter elegans TaxID=997 RepID=UPI0003F855B0|nr:pyridoxamine 5'-phosphate oxidase [Eisenibacter elegans]